MTVVASPTQAWLNASLGLVYPESCQLCHAQRATAREEFVWAQCWSHVRFIRGPFCERCGLPFEGDLATTFECTNCRFLLRAFHCGRQNGRA
jgi:predicted amidophosphoribosyltransferase